jgi:hypothetical protein
MSDLETRIREHPLPTAALLRPGNAAFLLACLGDAIRLFARLPRARPESLFRPPGGPAKAGADIERAAIAHAFTDRLLRSKLFPVRRTCLRRSLLLAKLLRRTGIEVTICFGVKHRSGVLEGHSWLEREGGAFLEPDENWREYACIFTLPRPD